MHFANRKSPRIKGYDYSKENIYFITSCVKGWTPVFGEVENGKMQLNEYGMIAECQWNWLFTRYHHIKSHAFVVMPNHIHGLIEIIRSPEPGTLESPVKILPLYRIIGAYKTTVSKKIHLAGNKNFEWQRSFHDSIARDARSVENIKRYIEKNPERWKK